MKSADLKSGSEQRFFAILYTTLLYSVVLLAFLTLKLYVDYRLGRVIAGTRVDDTPTDRLVIGLMLAACVVGLHTLLFALIIPLATSSIQLLNFRIWFLSNGVCALCSAIFFCGADEYVQRVYKLGPSWGGLRLIMMSAIISPLCGTVLLQLFIKRDQGDA